MAISWKNAADLTPKSYVCGYCSNSIASQKGFFGEDEHRRHYLVFICHKCSSPSYFDNTGKQYPGAVFGQEVRHLPDDDVKSLYSEARKCMTVNAYTGVVLCSRKLLMNIAVSKGAAEGLSFLAYVDHLASKGYVPPDGKDWVDHIRQKGNEATHQIKIMTKEDAEDLITFVEALLKFIYEYPGIIAERKKAATTKP